MNVAYHKLDTTAYKRDNSETLKAPFTLNPSTYCLPFVQAASLTEMWILLDARNAGLTSMVGEAVSKEKSRRNILKTEQTLVRFPSQEPLPNLTVIGVLCQSDLGEGTPTHSKMPIKGEALTIVVEDSRTDYTSQSHKSVCPFLTHMIVTSADMSHAAFNSFILKLEMSLIRSVEQERVRSLATGKALEDLARECDKLPVG
ncbi:hypothetical protein Btru_012763 [Bulinus truncatus]|nr:hypothetical protein Btru_012763 [Bulinus truncatus]